MRINEGIEGNLKIYGSIRVKIKESRISVGRVQVTNWKFTSGSGQGQLEGGGLILNLRPLQTCSLKHSEIRTGLKFLKRLNPVYSLS